jgi:hypothetical protein
VQFYTVLMSHVASAISCRQVNTTNLTVADDNNPHRCAATECRTRKITDAKFWITTRNSKFEFNSPTHGQVSLQLVNVVECY